MCPSPFSLLVVILIHAHFLFNISDSEIGLGISSGISDIAENSETVISLDRISPEEMTRSLDRTSHGTRDTSPMRYSHPSQPRRWSPEELRLISSGPPENPADSVGCVVLYSHWESGVRGNESTAKGLYELSVRKQRTEFSK